MSNTDNVLVIGSVDCNDGTNTFLESMSLGVPERTAESYGGPGIDIAASGPVDESDKYKTVVEVTVLREPWVYGAPATLYSASSVSLPAVLDLSAMTGDAPAPLDVLFDASSADIHRLAAGIYPESGVAITKFVRKAVDLTWDTGSATTDSAGWPDGTGNTVWRTNSATGASASVDVTDLAPGSYAVCVNAKRDAGASPATVGTSVTEAVDIEGTSLRRHLLGIVSLPLTAVRGSATSAIGIVLTSDGTDYAYLNTIEFIPVSWGCWGWHHATASGSCDKLRLEDGLTYADDVASLAYVQLGQQLKTLGGTLVVTAEGRSEAPTLAVTSTASYEPRYEQLPSAGSAGYGPSMD